MGTSHYFGDIGGATKRSKLFKKFEDFDLYETRFAFLAGMRYQINESFALSFNMIPALLAGDDKRSFHRDRNYMFHSIVLDGALQFEYFFLPWKTNFRPYVFAGLDATAWISNNIFESAIDRKIKLRNTWGTHSGLGFRKEITNYSSYGVNIALHRSFSDFIDGYTGSTSIPDMYYYVLFEYSTKIARRSIYNRKGLLRRYLIKKPNVYSEEEIQKLLKKERVGLNAKDRRAIKRHLKKIKKEKKGKKKGSL